jgi:hypothetical protein
MRRIGWPWIVIGFGVLLRLSQYWFDRSLWLDEAYLALNITGRSVSELLKPLDYNQGAPVGFLIVERLLVEAYGGTEYVLRFFPLVSGVAALFLFYQVASAFITPKAVPIALGLFAFSDPLIYYSSEAKQYSTDVAIGLLLYRVATYVESRKSSAPSIALFGTTGAAAVWLSHPAVFVLAGIASTLTVAYALKKDWKSIRSLSFAYAAWGLSLGVCLVISLGRLLRKRFFQDYWADGFVPFPPTSFSDLTWFSDSFFRLFENPAGLSLSGVAALAFLLGCVSLARDKPALFFLLLSPALFALAASGFHAYPFKDRLLLFLVPSLFLLIALGVESVRGRSEPRGSLLYLTLIAFLFFHPAQSAAHHLAQPRAREEIKPVLQYLASRKQEGDLVYLYHASQYAFKYYAKRFGLDDNGPIVGRMSLGNWGNYLKELNDLRGHGRVWILFSHVYKRTGVDEEKFFLFHLDSLGKRLDSFKSPGAGVYLYDLTPIRDHQQGP